MIEIEHQQMVVKLAKPGADILESLTPALCHLMHMTIGIAGETGELMEVLTGSLVDMEHANEELGDLEFYLRGARGAYLINRNETLGLVHTWEEAGSTDVLTLAELGEYVAIGGSKFVDVAKRIFIYRKPDYGREQIVEALSYLELYLARLRHQLGVEWTDTLRNNLNKLLKGDSARYAEGSYSDEQANTRADKQTEEGGVQTAGVTTGRVPCGYERGATEVSESADSNNCTAKDVK